MFRRLLNLLPASTVVVALVVLSAPALASGPAGDTVARPDSTEPTLAAAVVPLFPEVFVKNSGNPVLDVGAAGSWEAAEAFTPCVVFDGILYHMWYTGADATHSTKIGHATSLTGLVWVKDAANPVLSPSGGWDSSDTRFPAVILDAGTFKMWYTAENPAEIGYATSADGTTWDRGAEPVLRRGEPGAWDGNWVGFPTVVKANGTYHMWYIGRSGGVLTSAVGYATSPNGVTWTKHSANPVFEALTSDWEEGGIEAASVTYDGLLFHLWYSAKPGEVGHAVSADGVTWVRRGRVLARGAEGSYDADGADYAFVIAGSSGYMMWYSALDDEEAGAYRIAYASASYAPIVYLPMQQHGFGAATQ